MTDREKLADILENLDTHGCAECQNCAMLRYGLECDDRCFAEKTADYLIAHGVSTSTWIPVTERLPLEEYNEYKERWRDDEDPAFLVMIEYAVLPNRLYFDGEHWYQEMHGCIYPYKVTHWMNMPEPPAKD